mmetsp:Transcript_8894/g.25405  ORF Transcript_8894/g.25405 Transcript_8894/m.25405 type:complete len:200 (-) Transcript_8894:393-992(-)
MHCALLSPRLQRHRLQGRQRARIPAPERHRRLHPWSRQEVEWPRASPLQEAKAAGPSGSWPHPHMRTRLHRRRTACSSNLMAGAWTHLWKKPRSRQRRRWHRHPQTLHPQTRPPSPAVITRGEAQCLAHRLQRAHLWGSRQFRLHPAPSLLLTRSRASVSRGDLSRLPPRPACNPNQRGVNKKPLTGRGRPCDGPRPHP